MIRRNLAWMPAFLAGVAAATAAELAAGLLLYSGAGFLRALTSLLSVQMAAFALGLWTARGPTESPGIEAVRRRWLLSLVAYTVAAAFAVSTSVFGPSAGGAAIRGLGLAVLGGLPLFAVASLLGAMSRLAEAEAAPAADESRTGVPVSVGTAAAMGAAAGFMATGVLLVPNLEPSAILLVCVIVLAAGALLHGWVLDRRELAQVMESRWTARGLVQVEDRVQGSPPARRRVILEAGRVRGAEAGDGLPARSWEAALLERLRDSREVPAAVLFVGVGSGTLARALSTASRPAARVVGVEPNETLARMARAHFPPGQEGDSDPWRGVEVRGGRDLDDAADPGERFDLIVVDASAFGSADGVPPVVPGRLASLTGALTEGGLLVLAGGVLPDADPAGLEAWMAEARTCFPPGLTLEVEPDTRLVVGRAVSGQGRTADRPDPDPYDPADPGPVAPEPPGP